MSITTSCPVLGSRMVIGPDPTSAEASLTMPTHETRGMATRKHGSVNVPLTMQEPLPPIEPNRADQSGLHLQAPATRREVLLFGLLILALVWALGSREPRTVLVVPDGSTRVGVIT